MSVSRLRILCLSPVLLLSIAAAAPAAASDPNPPEAPMDEVARADMADSWAYDTLQELCDTVGPRLACSPAMDRAVAWAVRTMKAAGCDSVWTEPATIPHWERGHEWARCTAPEPFDLTMTGLGFSDGTPPGGVEAELLVVRDFDELEARGGEAEGKIVLFDMPWEGYGKTVQYRVKGASAAARHGAVAALIRSVTGRSLATPHTGMMRYDDDAPRIPIAAVTVEDAARLHDLADRGPAPPRAPDDGGPQPGRDHQPQRDRRDPRLAAGPTRSCWWAATWTPGTWAPAPWTTAAAAS